MQRLHQSSDIADIFASTKPQYLEGLQIYLKVNNLFHNRLGVIIPKKFVTLAVDRNRLKRQIRELFRKSIDIKNHKYDIIILVRTKITSQNKNYFLRKINNFVSNLT